MKNVLSGGAGNLTGSPAVEENSSNYVNRQLVHKSPAALCRQGPLSKTQVWQAGIYRGRTLRTMRCDSARHRAISLRHAARFADALVRGREVGSPPLLSPLRSLGSGRLRC